MAAGTPVIAGRAGSVPEVCGDAALLFDPLDVDGLAAAMLRVASDVELRSGLAARGVHARRSTRGRRVRRGPRPSCALP